MSLKWYILWVLHLNGAHCLGGVNLNDSRGELFHLSHVWRNPHAICSTHFICRQACDNAVICRPYPPNSPLQIWRLTSLAAKVPLFESRDCRSNQVQIRSAGSHVQHLIERENWDTGIHKRMVHNSKGRDQMPHYRPKNIKIARKTPRLKGPVMDSR